MSQVLILQIIFGVVMAFPILYVLSEIIESNTILQRIVKVKKRSSIHSSLLTEKEEKERSEKRKRLEKYLKTVGTTKTKKGFPIEVLLVHAGFNISKLQFYLLSLGLMIAVVLILLLKAVPLYIALVIGALAGAFLPKKYVQNRINKLAKEFVKHFPDALDIIIRGVKSGFSVQDSLKLVAEELAPPISTEFGFLVDHLKVGMSVEQSLRKFYDKNPSKEARFFSILLIIQNKSGGNLSEALLNLTGMMRDRAALRAKIEALSSEAKASAYIMGVLPFAIGFFIFLQDKHYFDPFFKNTLGLIVLAGAIVWISIGIIVMLVMMKIKV